MPPGPEEDPAAGEELCALLAELKQAGGLSYDALAVAAAMGRNTVLNYITKPGHRRDTRTVEQLLTALRAPGPARDRALELHRRTQPAAPDPAAVGWAARASSNEFVFRQDYDNPEEFRLVVDLLRNEGPLTFNDLVNYLYTNHGPAGEPVGEGEPPPV